MNSETKLFYLKIKFHSNRLCISKKCQKRFFQYDHDDHVHEKIHRIYDLLTRSIFIPKMRKLIVEYVINCFVCQLSKSSKQFSYDELQFIFLSLEPFFELNFDFIVGLSVIVQKNNAILSVTDRFFKYIKAVSSKKTMSTMKWKTFYWKFVVKNWEISAKLINDRDFKFNSNFWETIFKQCDAFLEMIAAYHPSVDGQTKRSNQTIETVLRCLLVKEYEEKWKKTLSHVKYSLNIFENRFTRISFFEIFYEIKSKNPLLKIVRKNPFSEKKKTFMKIKRQIKFDVMNAIHLTQTKMAALWNAKHRSPNLKKKVYLKMTKQNRSNYHLPKSNFLSIKKLSSFSIKKKVKNLIYELELSTSMKIHLVVSIIHLKQAKENDFHKKGSEIPSIGPAPVIVEGVPQYVVERDRRGNLACKVSFEAYGGLYLLLRSACMSYTIACALRRAP